VQNLNLNSPMFFMTNLNFFMTLFAFGHCYVLIRAKFIHIEIGPCNVCHINFSYVI
jgi:hypothetical protein